MAEPLKVCCLCKSSEAKCCCTCATFPLPLCLPCVFQHISTPGTHPIQTLQQATALSAPPGFAPVATAVTEACAECGTEAATTVCTCEQGGVLLCSGCCTLHIARKPGGEHYSVPITAKRFVRCPGYVEKLKNRLKRYQDGLKETQANLSMVTKCQETLVKKHQKIVELMDKYREKTLNELEKYRSQLEEHILAAKNELESHIYEHGYSPVHPLSQAIWDYEPGKLVLFTFQHQNFFRLEIVKKLSPFDPAPTRPPRLSPIPRQTATKATCHSSVFSTTVDLSVTDALRQTPFQPSLNSYVFFLTNSSLVYRNVAVQSPATEVCLSTTINVAPLWSGCELPTGALLVCGAKKVSPQVATFEIAVETGHVTQVGDMLEWKYAHGLALVGGVVYSFGGTGAAGMLSSTEAYSLAARSWARRACMISARDRFNPCVCFQLVYLFGGRKTTNCEVYDPVADVFSSLGITVPKSGTAMAVRVSDEELLIIGKSYQCVWNAKEQRVVKMVEKPLKGGAWGNMNPILVDGSVYASKFSCGQIKQISISDIFSNKTFK